MHKPTLPPATNAYFDLVERVAALASTLAAAVVLVNLLRLSREPGTSGWQLAAIALCLSGAIYLMLAGFEHWGRRLRPHQALRAEPWLSLLVLVLVWFVLARGHGSRLLLAGLAPTIAALAASATVSVLVYVRARVILQRPAPISARSAPLAPWRCVLAACVLSSVLYLETRSLPEIKPWETPQTKATP